MRPIIDITIDQLDLYQQCLLDALARGGSPAEVKAWLLADERCHELRDYVASIDVHALEPMIVLSRRWRLDRPARW